MEYSLYDKERVFGDVDRTDNFRLDNKGGSRYCQTIISQT